jgi:hypothetical protein
MSTGAAVLAWIGLGLGLGALLQVLVLFYRVLRPLREIKRYTDDILAAGLGIARNLDPVEEAEETRRLATALPGAVRRALGGT